MKVTVLGSAAGGGFPQWNCNCRNCAGVRAGTINARARTQSSIVVSGVDANDCVLVNASPDVLKQLHAARGLQPARAVRDSAIQSIMLMDAQIDHTTGLYMLREATRPWPVWCTQAVHRDLTEGNPIFRVLEHYCGVEWCEMQPTGEPFTAGGAAGVNFRATALASKPPPFSPNRAKPTLGDNVGLTFEDSLSGGKIFYAPGLGAVDEVVWECMRSADCVLLDGTFWSEDEMRTLGLSSKLAHEMGHLPQSGENGLVAWLDKLPRSTRKILIHINNSNPILDEGSAERAHLSEHGIEVAFDGMEITL